MVIGTNRIGRIKLTHHNLKGVGPSGNPRWLDLDFLFLHLPGPDRRKNRCTNPLTFRSHAKVLNFSIVYGVTEFGLARNLSITRGEAKELMANYFAAFPGIKIYMQQTIDAVREKGYAENLFGRRRLIGEIKSANHFVRQGAERLAINTPVQSTAADLIKNAMIVIHEKLIAKKMQSRMVLQIHDELLFEVPPDEEKELETMAKREMEQVVALKVPLKVSGAFGRNWNECKG